MWGGIFRRNAIPLRPLAGGSQQNNYSSGDYLVHELVIVKKLSIRVDSLSLS
jgi:hypothetical protein